MPDSSDLDPASPRQRLSPVRWIGTLAALAALVASGCEYSGRSAPLRQLETALAAHGADERHAELAPRVRRQLDVVEARLLVARAFLADELDRGWLRPLSAERQAAELEKGPGRLAVARELARESLRERPGSWQAAMVYGGATYLERGRRRGAATAAGPGWRPALEHARRLAPHQPEPLRLLLAAAFGDWSRLDREARAELALLVPQALRDPGSFDLLVLPWQRLAPSSRAFWQSMPDRPGAWTQVERLFADRRDWSRYAGARDRWYTAVETHLAQLADDAAARERGGDARHARALRAAIVDQAPTESHFAPLVAAALDGLGVDGGRLPDPRAVERWRNWERQLCPRLDPCPLPAAARQRLDELADAAALPPPPAAPGADGWSGDRSRTARVVAAEAAATALSIELRRVAAGGTAIDVFWDGERLGTYAVQSGESLRVAVAVTPGAHLLRLEEPLGRAIDPGPVRLHSSDA